MNIEDTLKERLTQMSADVQGAPSLQRALERGRARRRRRGLAAVGSGVAAVCAVGVVTGAALAGGGPFDGDAAPHDEESAWALSIPPEDVPAAVEQVVRDRLPSGAQITDTTVHVYSDEEKPSGLPVQLPRDEWDRGVSWESTFKLGAGEIVRVDLTNSPEDDASNGFVRKQCENDRHCNYSELADGTPVSEVTQPLRKAENPASIFAGQWVSGIDPSAGDPDTIWYSRDVVVHLGGLYQVRVQDAVNVPTREQAESSWTMDMDLMRDIATDEGFLENPTD